MRKKQPSRAPIPHVGNPEGNLALPLDTQVEMADLRRRLAIRRYEIAKRRGNAWLDHEVADRKARN